ncbi:MAG: histidine--tRNA ligase, partial [Bacteroidales bacterium]|nr:histidine--tRNA ligase [Bacteroidales bacterium]
SICGGGRYADLTGIFGLNNMSGVGISFGADRIYDVMLQAELFPENIDTPAKIMFINFGKTEEISAIQVINTLRKSGISAFIYPEQAKMKKQIQYADNNHIPLIALMGENEIKAHSISIKNLASGEQNDILIKDIVKFIQ